MRRTITVVALLAFLVVGAGGIWWLFAASLLERQVQLAISEGEKRGYSVNVDSSEKAGFPDFVRVVLRNVRIESGGNSHPHSAEFEEIVVWSRPWSPGDVFFESRKPHAWRWRDGVEAPERRADIATMFGTLTHRLDASGWRSTLDFLDINVSADEPLASGIASIESLSGQFELPLDRSILWFNFRLDQMTLAQETLFGSSVHSATADGSIVPIPAGADADHLHQWRQAGGELELFESSLSFETVSLTSRGKLALDGQRRPAGKLAVKLLEPSRVRAAVTDAGMISGDEAALVRLGVGLLARRDANGAEVLDAPVEFRDGLAWLGPIAVFPVPPLAAPKGR